MQTQTRTALSGRKMFAAATALLAASVFAINGLPGSANAAPAFAAAAPYAVPHATIHEGVDWSRVTATPVDAGATVGAYGG